MRVIQSLIVHDAIGKPKILLDQLREGLQTLGFGSRMQVYPELFKELFVAGEKEMKGSDIKEILMFPSEMSDAEKTIMEHMTEFIVQLVQHQIFKRHSSPLLLGHPAYQSLV